MVVNAKSRRLLGSPLWSRWVASEHNWVMSKRSILSFKVWPLQFVLSPINQSLCLALKSPTSKMSFSATFSKTCSNFHLGQCPLQSIQCRNAVARFYVCHARRKKFSEGLPCIVLLHCGTLCQSTYKNCQVGTHWQTFLRTRFSLLPAFSHSHSFLFSL